MQQYTIQKRDGNMAKLTIEVPAEKLEDAVEQVYRRDKGYITVPGFRKGKAPRKIVEKMYGPQVFYEDAANDLVPDAYYAAFDECEEQGDFIVSSPEIKVEQMELGKPFIFTADVALKPPVTLGDYRGVEIPRFGGTVTEEEVNAEIERERSNSARVVTVEGRPVRNGDIVSLDFQGYIDDKPFDGGRGENYSLEIGSGEFIPGFEEQLVGANAGEDVEVNVVFPDDYREENLAGKAATFKCKVNGLKEKELPELDDDFASEVSIFDTFEEYKEDVRATLQQQKDEESKRSREDAAIEAVVRNAEMDIPDAMVETEQHRVMDQFGSNLRMQGLSMNQYMMWTGNSRDDMMQKAGDQALKSVQGRLVLEAIAKNEGMDVTTEEVDAEVKRLSEMYQLSESQIRDNLGTHGLKSVETDLLVRKAIDLITENAVQVDKPADGSKEEQQS